VAVPIHGNRALKEGLLHQLLKRAGLTIDDI
jgi:predicted RNA binding protein YcfA (HicA-like mRNA interferase family)